ncbi:hypothetical protein ACOMHN_042311 [Nucella lapillus]
MYVQEMRLRAEHAGKDISRHQGKTELCTCFDRKTKISADAPAMDWERSSCSSRMLEASSQSSTSPDRCHPLTH